MVTFLKKHTYLIGLYAISKLYLHKFASLIKNFILITFLHSFVNRIFSNVKENNILLFFVLRKIEDTCDTDGHIY